MLAAMRVSPAHSEDVRRKPGRQWVTFLLVCNFALWGINTFETQRTEHNLLQVSVEKSLGEQLHSAICLFSPLFFVGWLVRSFVFLFIRIVVTSQFDLRGDDLIVN